MNDTQSNVFGYMRISTKEERGKQRYNRQEKALTSYAEKNGFEYLIVFKEDASAKNFSERREWNSLERVLKPGDTIVMKDISRFTREAENGYSKYMELFNNGIRLVFLDNPTVSTDYIHQLTSVAAQQDLIARTSMESTIKLLLIVELDRVEKERLTLIKRTKDGIAASPKQSGRAKGHLDKMSPALAEDLKLYLTDRTITQKSLMDKYHISRNTLKKYAQLIKAGSLS